MGLLVIFIVILVVICFIAWLIKTQNKLVILSEFCSNGLAQIGVQQTSRWDMLSSLADLVGQYSEFESKTIKDIIAQRSPITDSKISSESVEKNEVLLEQASKLISVTVESYPTLKADSLYSETMGAIKKQEDNVRLSRMIYNDSVTKFNREIKLIPTCFIAGMLGFKSQNYLEFDTEKANMPNIKR